MSHGEDTCKGDEAEEIRETYAKLSVIHVTKRDISVATAPSIHGTSPMDRVTGSHILVKDVRQ